MSIPNPLDLKNLSLSVIRKFFSSRGIEEVITPLLVRSGGIEPYVDPVSLSDGIFLPTSPEISLKKTLGLKKPECRGIYEIAHAFRDDNQSIIHLKEFTMVEWYKRNSHFEDFIPELTALMESLSQLLPEENSNLADLLSCKVLSIPDLFREHYQVVIQADWHFQEFQELYRLNNENYVGNNSRDTDPSIELLEIFSFLLDKAIMNYQRENPVLVYIKDFPPFLRGMAKVSSDGWAMRLEAYYRGVELCSGYQEIDDPDELANIWEMNNTLRSILKKPIHPVDQDLLELTPRMQGVAGMALGLERTLMALFNIDNIQKFKLDRFV